MRLLRTIILSTAVLAAAPHVLSAQEPKDTLPPAPEGKTWKLVWHDEFDGTKLDMNKWVYGRKGSGETAGGAARP